MQFMFQLIGKAGGGSIDLGDVTVLQVFADLRGEYYEDGENAVIVHRRPCPAVLATPEGIEATEPLAIRLVSGFDDSILIEEWQDEREEEHGLAHAHGFCSKVFGVPVAANLDLPVEGEDGQELRHIVQMIDIDDWFLWFVFANEDFTEARLEIVRG
jgi:hypothetical protein